MYKRKEFIMPAKEKRFNELTVNQKNKVLSKDFSPEHYQNMIDFLKEDIFGGPLIDMNTFTIKEF
jgi:hypothetical protein